MQMCMKAWPCSCPQQYFQTTNKQTENTQDGIFTPYQAADEVEAADEQEEGGVDIHSVPSSSLPVPNNIMSVDGSSSSHRVHNDLYGSPNWSHPPPPPSHLSPTSPVPHTYKHGPSATAADASYYEQEDADLIHAFQPIHPYQQQQQLFMQQNRQLHIQQPQTSTTPISSLSSPQRKPASGLASRSLAVSVHADSTPLLSDQCVTIYPTLADGQGIMTAPDHVQASITHFQPYHQEQVSRWNPRPA